MTVAGSCTGSSLRIDGSLQSRERISARFEKTRAPHISFFLGGEAIVVEPMQKRNKQCLKTRILPTSFSTLNIKFRARTARAYISIQYSSPPRFILPQYYAPRYMGRGFRRSSESHYENESRFQFQLQWLELKSDSNTVTRFQIYFITVAISKKM